MQHCTWVRDELGHCRRNVHIKRLNYPIHQASGGLQLSVDLSTAFDRVPRWALRRALQWAGADNDITRTIEELHEQCRYPTEHAGFQGVLCMKRGVRQGCTLAPLLFTIFTCFLADIIGQRTDRQWMLEHLTLYADDTHASWEIRHGRDLRFVEHSIQTIYAVFQEFGMCVNASKSVLVLGLHGSVCKNWTHQRLQTTKQGKFMHFGSPLLPLCIPVYSEMRYLGITASYGSLEVQTMKHRLRIAAGSRQRHEDELAQSRTEKEFVLTFEVHGGGILSLMWGFAQAAQEWKKAREEKKVFSSLRLTLFLAFLQEWQQHLEKMAQPEAQEGAIKLGVAQRNAQDQSAVILKR
ncbi:unnamed protein product [Symbiodinium pilosum]|uniref:Reverse transcriptase domain-containing protein n=1 Tax=Symbiodinium pilosum TaxID=2952 RepID=A0A812QX74_SYMPI|nr:unnamed protein product [Symbiodinium pilosum]